MQNILENYHQIWKKKSTNDILKEKDRLETIIVESPEKIKRPYRYIIQDRLCKHLTILNTILKNRALNT